jgi:subtilisin
MKKSLLILIAFLAIILLSGTASSVKPQRDVIIVYHKTPATSEKALIHINEGVAKHSYHLIPAISARLPEQAIENMRKDPRIAYIEEDTIVAIAKDEYANSWGVSHIGSEIVHNNGINGTGVKVAVIDTGINYTHEDLDDNYISGYDFVYDDTDPMDDSYNSHGTHVAGIIAAENNGIGVVGVAPNASLYAVKVLDGSGHGLTSWVIAGIEWAVDNDMDIATMSLAGSQDSKALEDASNFAYNNGVLLIAAAGSTDGGDVTYPARYDSVIAVTATDQNDQQAGSSSIGPEVELAAPGVDIRSTIGGDSSYGYLSGTSQAAPHVAGTAALIFSSNLQDVNGEGTVNHEDVRLQLQRTAEDLGEPGKDDLYGYGLVSAKAAAVLTTPAMTEDDCMICHGYTTDRHHMLVPNEGYKCTDCHPVKRADETSRYYPEVIRDCLVCHECYHINMRDSHTYTEMDPSCISTNCHASNYLPPLHDDYAAKNASFSNNCFVCHTNPDPERIDWTTATANCTSCHPTAGAGHYIQHEACPGDACTPCHLSNLIDEHDAKGYSCDACHDCNDPCVVSAIEKHVKDCGACHE